MVFLDHCARRALRHGRRHFYPRTGHEDFATESSEDKLRTGKACHLMAQKLAGSLALVICKEPLKSNLCGYLCTALADHGFSEQVISEQLLSILVADGIEVARTAIGKAAMERAVTDVEESFVTLYKALRRHRELRSGRLFWGPQAPPATFRWLSLTLYASRP
jgi:CCR4-NOT transcription complex subunit 1